MTIRAPHFSKRVERDVQPPPAVPNLLITTLAVAAVAAPFSQTDWPNPRSERLYEVLQTGRAVTAIQPPFKQTDWPNPQLEHHPQAQQTVKSIALVEAAAAAQLIRQSDWPNPQTQPIQESVQAGMPLGILEDAGEKPFLLSEWPQPEPDRTVQLEQISKSIALVEPQDPFFQTEWPNPEIRAVQQPLEFINVLALPGEKPFAQTEWPNPTLRVHIQQPVQIPKSIALVETVADPFSQRQWPNPKLTVEIQTPFQLGMPLVVLEDAGEKPFLQTEWPYPPPLPTQEPWQYGKSIALIETVFDPFFQLDWPNPKLEIKIQTPYYPGKSIALVEAPVVVAAAFAGRHIAPTWSGKPAKIAQAETRVTTTYTVLVTDEIVFANTDGGAFTTTLPAGAEGLTFIIINSGSSANNLTLEPDGTEHLFGSNTNFELTDGESLEIRWNETDGWY